MRPSNLFLYLPVTAFLLVFTLLVLTARISIAEPTAEREAPSVEAMLSLSPVIKGVKFSTASSGELANLSVRRIERQKVTGWLLRDADSTPLRRFIDTNGDGDIDRWVYYHQGAEVYRDVDTDYDGIADKAVRTHILVRDESGRLVVEQSDATDSEGDDVTTEGKKRSIEIDGEPAEIIQVDGVWKIVK